MNGNLTQKVEGSDTWGYEWNAEDQLTRVTRNSVEQARFKYDPLGRRVEKVAGSATNTWTYQAEDILREVAGATTLKYVHGPSIDEPLATDDGSTLVAFQADGLGSVSKTTSASGVITLARQYDAWGNLEIGDATGGYAFTGREWETETGLYYYRARYNEPRIGRFISSDPIQSRSQDVLGVLGQAIPVAGIPDAILQPFVYANNSPTDTTDPSGLLSKSPRDCSNRSPDCENYGVCYSYAGASAACFCKCASNGPWSSQVRCCLFEKFEAGWDADSAHRACYAEAGLSGLPWGELARCYGLCVQAQQYACGCGPKGGP